MTVLEKNQIYKWLILEMVVDKGWIICLYFLLCLLLCFVVCMSIDTKIILKMECFFINFLLLEQFFVSFLVCDQGNLHDMTNLCNHMKFEDIWHLDNLKLYCQLRAFGFCSVDEGQIIFGKWKFIPLECLPLINYFFYINMRTFMFMASANLTDAFGVELTWIESLAYCHWMVLFDHLVSIWKNTNVTFLFFIRSNLFYFSKIYINGLLSFF